MRQHVIFECILWHFLRNYSFCYCTCYEMFPVSRIVYITLTCRAVLIKLEVTVLAFPFTVIGMLDAWPDNVRFHGNRFRCSVSLSFCAQFLNITLTMQELQSICVRTMVVLEATGMDSVWCILLSSLCHCFCPSYPMVGAWSGNCYLTFSVLNDFIVVLTEVTGPRKLNFWNSHIVCLFIYAVSLDKMTLLE